MAGEQDAPSRPPAEDPPPADARVPLDPHLGMLDRAAPGRPPAVGGDVGDRERSRAGLVAITTVVLLPGLAVLVAVLLSLASGPPSAGTEASPDQDLTRRWCTYTATSQSAYDACLKTADPRVVRREDSDAGRFARGELLRCLPGAGPLCVTR